MRTTELILTADEILAVLHEAKARSARDHAAILITYRHGMRASEVCSLKLADLDMKNRQVEINGTHTSHRSVHRLVEYDGINCVLLDEPRVIEKYLSERVEDGSGYLFLGKNGALTTAQFHRIFRDIALAAGLAHEKAVVHSLRCSQTGGGTSC